MRARTIARAIIVASGAFVFGCAGNTSPDSHRHPTTMAFAWSKLADLPDAHGFAGAYAGVSNGALIVAGGANFPDAPPWKGGSKVWHDTGFVLERGATTWKRVDAALPTPRGYGASITMPTGVVCIGGSDLKQHFADVFVLEYKDGIVQHGKAEAPQRRLPPLPMTLANFAAAAIGSKIFVVGGNDSPAATTAQNRLFVIDTKAPAAAWLELPALPGPGRILPVAAVVGNDLFVVSGASLAADAANKPVRTYLTDAYRYSSGQGWSRVADVPHPVVAAPSPAMPCSGGFAIFGGDDGANVNFEPKEQHPGFSRDIIAYDASADQWHVVGQLALSQVTTSTVSFDGKFIIPSGEIRPAVRTPVVSIATSNQDVPR